MSAVVKPMVKDDIPPVPAYMAQRTGTSGLTLGAA